MRIALTFDIERDIPHVLDTYFGVKYGLLKILQLLDDFHIKATFFCTGNIAKYYPDQIKLIHYKGHEISCHGLNHERLNLLEYSKCKELVFKNKKLLDNLSTSLRTVGFRAPYLNPPKYLFKLLADLDFKYDSSVISSNKHQFSQLSESSIQEFHPSSYYHFFRFPLSYPLITKKIFQKELMVLYFHVWEAVDMKRLILNQKQSLNILKSFLVRPDRWYNTGDIFIKRFRKLLQRSLSKKADFVLLNQLIRE